MNLWHYILREYFDSEIYVDIFRKVVPQLTAFNFMTQIRHWLRWLRCFARNTFLSDYSDYADLYEIVSSQITLTTQIFKHEK